MIQRISQARQNSSSTIGTMAADADGPEHQCERIAARVAGER